MRALVGVALLFCSLRAISQVQEVHTMTGIAVNLADPEKPLAAKIEFKVENGVCTLTVLSPLYGSGPCHIKVLDKETHRTEITSDGPPTIVWTGTTKGNFFSGTYLIAGAQQAGSFYLARLKPSAPPAAVAKPISRPCVAHAPLQ